MIGYKLFRLRKDGSLGPLFINRRQKLHVGGQYVAEEHPTNGFLFRPGWHICSKQDAPHLSKNGRVWAKVEFSDYQEHQRPANQGGLWFTAKHMKIIEILR